MITDQQFNTWLKDANAIRCVLVEADVKLASSGSIVTRYLSSKGYTTGASDTPANTSYSARIVGGVKFTRSLSMEGQASLSFGDIELNNIDGSLDSWLDDFWVNRQLRVYIGDARWARSDFRLVFTGVLTGVDTRNRTRINLKISDTLQRLNNPVTEVTRGGSGTNSEDLLPLLFGECHNITPLQIDSTVNEYMIHNGPIERIIEVRDNGVPVAFTAYLTEGKFRLNANPAGTITVSAQGAKFSAPVTLTDLDVSTANWTKVAVTAAATTAVTSPVTGATIYGIVPSTANTTHYLDSVGVSVAANAVTTASCYVYAGAGYQFEIGTLGVTTDAYHSALFTFSTNGVVLNTNTNYNSSGGSTVSYGADAVGGGWYRLWVSGSPDTTSTQRKVRVRLRAPAGTTFTGDGSSVYAYMVMPQLEINQSVYKNNIVDICTQLMTQYGGATTKLTDVDLDTTSMVQFKANNPQPVGIYLSERENVLDVVTKLVSSIGGRPLVNTAGKVAFVKLSLPQAYAGTSIGPNDMLDRTLEVKQMADVVASVKIGYDKNWTVQTGLTTGILPEHAALYAEEWLTQTAKDSLTAANYNLYTDPTQVDTYLLTASDALAEANRRLGIFKTQRKVMKYTGFYHLIFESLGSPQTITHSRFGLAAGKTGQIVSVSLDLMSPHVDFEVLI